MPASDLADLTEKILGSLVRPGDGPNAADRLDPLTVLTRLLPPNRGSKPPHVAKAHRAREQGTPIPGGGRVYWEQVRGSSGWYSTRRMLAEYLAKLTLAHQGRPIAADSESIDSPTRTPSTARRREYAQAEAELAAAGF